MNRYTPDRKTQMLVFWGAMLLLAGLTFAVIGVVGSQPSSDPAAEKIRMANEQKLCSGNERDTCIAAPSVDLYPAGNESPANLELRDNPDDVWKSIGGVVTSANGTLVKLQTTSNRTFAVEFPVSIRSWWNTNIGPSYDNYSFGAGDTIRVDYAEPAGQSATTIKPNQITRSVLATDPDTPASQPIKRYPQP